MQIKVSFGGGGRGAKHHAGAAVLRLCDRLQRNVLRLRLLVQVQTLRRYRCDFPPSLKSLYVSQGVKRKVKVTLDSHQNDEGGAPPHIPSQLSGLRLPCHAACLSNSPVPGTMHRLVMNNPIGNYHCQFCSI